MKGNLWKFIVARMPKNRLLKWMDLYPPYLGAGVKVRHVSADFRSFTVAMPLRPWNQNYVGTHFGGSLYSLADPWFMLILIENLGDGYVVWDKAASIRFVRPGRGTVHAHFEITAERIEAIRVEADREGRAEPVFSVTITDDAGETVAEVEKRISVRRKARGRVGS